MDARHFMAANGFKLAAQIINAPYPIVGWCCTGHNFIHKQCDAAPTQYSNEDNSWSEEYAVDLIRSVDLKFHLEQIIAKAPASDQYCQYYSPKQQKYLGFCDFYGYWYEWFDLKHDSHWSRIYLPEQLASDRVKLADIRQALAQCK